MKLNKPLHGLRGAAACTVVLGHYEIIQGAPSLGVVLFFVLSGFLIGKLYLEKEFNRDTVGSYLVARFARVYPLFAVVVVTVGGIGYFIPSLNAFDISPLQIVRNLMLLGKNLTIWTISTEFQFYLFFVLIWLTRSKSKSATKVVLPLLALSIAGALAWHIDTSRTGLPGYLHIFTLGIAISLVPTDTLHRWERPAQWCLPILLVAFCILFVTASRGLDIYLDPLCILTCAGILTTSLIAKDGIANRFLSSTPMVWAGEISFGIYLLHRPAAAVVDMVAPNLSHPVSLSCKLLLTLAMAYTAHRIIEKPARSVIRQQAEPLLRANLKWG